jgi:hypothetical protein
MQEQEDSCKEEHPGQCKRAGARIRGNSQTDDKDAVSEETGWTGEAKKSAGKTEKPHLIRG